MGRWRELSVALPMSATPDMVEALFSMFDRVGAPGSVLYDDPPRVAAYLPDDGRADEAAAQVEGHLTTLRHAEHLRRSEHKRHSVHHQSHAETPRHAQPVPDAEPSRHRQAFRHAEALRHAEPVEAWLLSSRVIEETDWSEAWKAFFRPRRIGQRLVVCPSWEQMEAGPEDVFLDLDPGQAFGTGEHPTTQMCLELLEQHLRPGDRVLDIGVGSGILSIAALKLGADRCVCCDVDPVSVKAAWDNLRRNGCADRADVVLAEGAGWCRTRFDLCVSNIISATLVRLAPDVAARLRPGGSWILSGVSSSNENSVLAACEEVGFVPAERREDGEWVALAVKR